MFSFWSIKGFGKRRKSLVTSSLTACFFHLGLSGSVSSRASSVQMACRVKGTDLRVKIHQRANPHWSFKMKCFCCDISLIYTCDRVFMGKVFPQWFAPIQPQAHSWGPVPLLVFQFIPNGAGWRWSLQICVVALDPHWEVSTVRVVCWSWVARWCLKLWPEPSQTWSLVKEPGGGLDCWRQQEFTSVVPLGNYTPVCTSVSPLLEFLLHEKTKVLFSTSECLSLELIRKVWLEL